jgi:hypothetical protein
LHERLRKAVIRRIGSATLIGFHVSDPDAWALPVFFLPSFRSVFLKLSPRHDIGDKNH